MIKFAFLRAIGYTIGMEQLTNNEQRKRTVFRFRFSPLLLAVMIVGLALCAACIGLTSWQLADFIRTDLTSVYDWLKFFLLYFVAGFLAVLIVSMLVKSQYILTDKELILQFGFVKSKYAIKKIFSARVFKKSNKLTVYFDDFKTKYMVIVVREDWYDEFVKELGSRNERIEFDYVSAEEEEEWKNNKKKK